MLVLLGCVPWCSAVCCRCWVGCVCDAKLSLVPPVLSLAPPQRESLIVADRDVIGKLATAKAHRMWAVDKDGKPCNVLSLTDMLVPRAVLVRGPKA